MPFELRIALRFLRAGGVQTALVVAGATVGVTVLVFMTALMDGVRARLVDKTLSSQPHVTLRRPEREVRVLPPSGAEAIATSVERPAARERSVEQWPRVLAAVRGAPGIVAAAPTAAGSALATRAEVSRSVALRGVEERSFDEVIRIRRRITAGRFSVQGTEAVIGVALAADLGLAIGDRLRVATAAGRADVFTVAGIFDLGERSANERWVLASLRAAQTLLDLEAGITAIEAKAEDPFEAEAIAAALADRTGLDGDSWMRVSAQLLSALRSQDASALLVEAFVVLAVAMGIASVLAVTVVQRSRHIGVLKATGASTGAILRVFLAEGALVGVAGSAAGCALGGALCWTLGTFARNAHGEALFPMELGPGVFLGASAVSISVAVLAALAPALRAARLDPAVAIRYG